MRPRFFLSNKWPWFWLQQLSLIVAARFHNDVFIVQSWRKHTHKLRCSQSRLNLRIVVTIVASHVCGTASVLWSTQERYLLIFAKRQWLWLRGLSLILKSCIQGHKKAKSSVNDSKQTLISAANPVMNGQCISAPWIAFGVPMPKAHVCISCLKGCHALRSDMWVWS